MGTGPNNKHIFSEEWVEYFWGGVEGVGYMPRLIMEILFVHPDYYYSHINSDGNIDGSYLFIHSSILRQGLV